MKYEKPIDGIVIDTNFFNDMCLHIIFWFIQTKTYNSQTISQGGRKNYLFPKTKKRIHVKRKISRKKIGGAGESQEQADIGIKINDIVVFSCIKLLKRDKTKINEILPFVSMTSDTYDKMYRYMCQQYINMDFNKFSQYNRMFNTDTFKYPPNEIKDIVKEDNLVKLKTLRYSLIELIENDFDRTKLIKIKYDIKDYKKNNYKIRELIVDEIFSLKDVYESTAYSIDDFIHESFDISKLKEAGFLVKELRKNNIFSLNDLESVGFSLKELNDGGFSASELYDVGFQLDQLQQLPNFKLNDLSVPQLKKEVDSKNLSISTLKTNNFTINILNAGNVFTLAELKIGGFTANEFKKEKFGAKDLTKNDLFTLAELKTEGRFTASELRNEKISAKKLNAPGLFSLVQLKDGGFTASDLKSEGFTATQLTTDKPFSLVELKKGGFTASELKSEGFRATKLNANGIFSLDELKKGGFTISDLKSEGFTAKQLNANGIFSLDELKTGGFTASKLKSEGFTAKKLNVNGIFSLDELKEGGFTLDEFKQEGFPANELNATGLFSLPEFKKEGFTAKQLNTNGLFTLEQLKTEGGFTLPEFKTEGFTAEQLTNDRFTFDDLIAAGFTLIEIFKTNLYTYGDIKNKSKDKKFQEQLKEQFKELKNKIIRLKCDSKINAYGIQHYDIDCKYNRSVGKGGYYTKKSHRINNMKHKLRITKKK